MCNDLNVWIAEWEQRDQWVSVPKGETREWVFPKALDLACGSWTLALSLLADIARTSDSSDFRRSPDEAVEMHEGSTMS